MNRERIEAIWSAILEMLKIASMVKKNAQLKFRCIEYTFNDLNDGTAEILARLEDDSAYITMVCGNGTIGSGKMFTGEEPGDFLLIENNSFKSMLNEIFPSGFEDEIRRATDSLNPSLTQYSVLRRIQELRSKEGAAFARAGGAKLTVK